MLWWQPTQYNVDGPKQTHRQQDARHFSNIQHSSVGKGCHSGGIRLTLDWEVHQVAYSETIVDCIILVTFNWIQ